MGFYGSCLWRKEMCLHMANLNKYFRYISGKNNHYREEKRKETSSTVFNQIS